MNDSAAPSDEFFLSNSDSTPMYSQIMEQVIGKVMAGDYLPGQALPSIRQLASASKVSVITVKRAYLELERIGVIITRQGKGSFVAESQDLPRQLALQDFEAHVTGMFTAASKLRMTLDEVLDEIREKAPAELADTSPHSLTGKRG